MLLPSLASLCGDSECETGVKTPNTIKAITDKLRKDASDRDREIKKRGDAEKKERERIENAALATRKREAAREAKQQAIDKQKMDAAGGRANRVRSEAEKVLTIDSHEVLEILASQTNQLYDELRTDSNQAIPTLEQFKQHYAESEKRMRGQRDHNLKMLQEAERQKDALLNQSEKYTRDRKAGVAKKLSADEKQSLNTLFKSSKEKVDALESEHRSYERELSTFREDWLYHRSPQLLEMLYKINKQLKPVTALDLYRLDMDAKYKQMRGIWPVPNAFNPEGMSKNEWQKRMWQIELKSEKDKYATRAKQQNSSANPTSRQKMVDEASQMAWESGLARYGQSTRSKLALYERKSLDVIPAYSSTGSVVIAVSMNWLNDAVFNRALATMFKVDGINVRKTNRMSADGGRISITCHGPDGGRVVFMGLCLAIVANAIDDKFASHRITFGDGDGGVVDDEVVEDGEEKNEDK